MLDIRVNSSGEDDNIYVKVEVPKHLYETIKSLCISVDAGKNLLTELTKWQKKSEKE